MGLGEQIQSPLHAAKGAEETELGRAEPSAANPSDIPKARGKVTITIERVRRIPPSPSASASFGD